MKSNIELPNKSNHPLRLPSPPPLPYSLSSLPEDIVLSCLARISKTHYPKLTLVSKSFRSLVLSKMLYKVRAQLQTQEECVYLSLESSFYPGLTWFSLWIKPDRQTLTQCTTQEKSTGNLLVPVPSSYSLHSPNIICLRVGSELYKFGSQYSLSSSVMSRGVSGKWREAPSMKVARKEPLMCVLHGKIYVMGGFLDHEYTVPWGEVFDPKTQTWEPLPKPGSLLRCSSYKKILPRSGKIYMKTSTKNFVYLIKENKWEYFEGHLEESFCVIENVKYSYVNKKCSWYETKSKEWRSIKGLAGLDAYSRYRTEICASGGKLVIFWDSLPLPSDLDRTKKIWCAVILLDKSLDGEVWGQIEWVDVVLKDHPLQSVSNIYSCVVRTY
ncbi:F-box domain [Arabidopsis thaliana x Arabidopsis arenosa]|uniref:F-box domain n=1 Tax=Arabidopsis thaliana x Arabidopsis arenosa TaxID=1240361 RepID=A0A8T1Y053_9BRAS|nr:F-box domain [Arabidopsis thaliana x Arabidopsis arenosa]